MKIKYYKYLLMLPLCFSMIIPSSTNISGQVEYFYMLRLENTKLVNQTSIQIIDNCKDSEYRQILNKSLENQIIQLFPFTSNKYNSQQAKLDIEDSVKNINTRLLNLKKINKSLDSFVNDSSQLNWDELIKINTELSENT